MSTKWYIGTLFLLFTYFGIYHEEVSIPNQEIVLEFVDTKVDQEDIESAIEDVRAKLLKIGVSDIKIEETESSTLKISYYSATDIDNIKEALLLENGFVVDENEENKEKDDASLEYKIDVYELTDETDLSSRNNQLVFENKFHLNRFTVDQNPSLEKSSKILKANRLFKIAYNSYKNNPFVKDYTSHKEPEVRAGPCSFII